MAAADRDQVGVALAQMDLLVRHAEPLGEDLREGRLVALADMLRAGDQRHRAVGLEADVDILLRRAAGALDVIGEAQPAPEPARLALPPPRVESGQVGALQRLVHRLGEGAAVDLEAEGVGHRHLVRRHHVDAAQLGAVEAGCSAAASISRSRMLTVSAKPGPRITPIGVVLLSTTSTCSAIDGQAIDRALQVHVLIGRHAAADAREIGADIGDARHLERQELARSIERQRRLGLHVARRMVGEEHLAAGGDPFHRPADLARRPGDQHVLGIDEVLGAEAAADIGRDEAQTLPARRPARGRRGCGWHGCSGSRCGACSGRSPDRTAPTEPRGSIGLVATRWLSRSSETTWAARANAASAPAASPTRQSMQMLPGTSGESCGAPAARGGIGRS